MDDFEQLWKNYQAQIRSENEVSARMQKQFWDVLYPLMLAKAYHVLEKTKTDDIKEINELLQKVNKELNKESLKKITNLLQKGEKDDDDILELIHETFLKIITEIKKNNNKLVIESSDNFCSWTYTIMRHLYVDKMKKEKDRVKPIDDIRKTEDINSISEEYTEDFSKEHTEDFSKEHTEVYSEEYKEDFSEEHTEDFDEEHIEEYSEEYSLIDSLNNIEVYDFSTAFSSFRVKYEDCHELISARGFEPKLPYKEIKEEDRFVNISLQNLRKMKERCMGYLRDFMNDYYLKLEL